MLRNDSGELSAQEVSSFLINLKPWAEDNTHCALYHVSSWDHHSLFHKTTEGLTMHH